MSLLGHFKQGLGASKLISILDIQHIYNHQLSFDPREMSREMSDVGNATS